MENIEKLVPCPIARSSNNDAYNDICGATGEPCPYFVDEGMSVCKSKAKCLAYFSKKGSKINLKEVTKLIASDTKSGTGTKRKYTNTIKVDKKMREAQRQEAEEGHVLFMEDLEAALKQHEDANEENGEN